jgi:hypothetical protein
MKVLAGKSTSRLAESTDNPQRQCGRHDAPATPTFAHVTEKNRQRNVKSKNKGNGKEWFAKVFAYSQID